MREPNRVFSICAEIAVLWFEKSDLRFNQLMTAFFNFIEQKNKDPFYVEDDEMIKLFREFMEQNKLGKRD